MKTEEMMEVMEKQCNEKLRKDGHSEMIREELVGGRLYTGPMYVKFNTVLRTPPQTGALTSRLYGAAPTSGAI